MSAPLVFRPGRVLDALGRDVVVASVNRVYPNTFAGAVAAAYFDRGSEIAVARGEAVRDMALLVELNNLFGGNDSVRIDLKCAHGDWPPGFVTRTNNLRIRFA